jgi:hypothetical protein
MTDLIHIHQDDRSMRAPQPVEAWAAISSG